VRKFIDLWRPSNSNLICVGLSLVFLYILNKDWLFKKVFPLEDGDFYGHGLVIKTIIDVGWWPAKNIYLGYPYSMEPYDFPGSDYFFAILIKILTVFTQDWMLIAIVLYVLSFPAIALLSKIVFSRMGIPDNWAICGGILFAFLPYHFLRIHHLFLSFYISVPLIFYLIIESVNGNKNFIKIFIISFIIAGSGVYYSFFGVFIIIMSMLYFYISDGCIKKIKGMFYGALFIIIFTALSLLPSFLYQIENGPNASAIPQRTLNETQINSLKPIQLILPTPAHRVSLLGEIESKYANNAALFPSEDRSSSLGLIGSLGFIAALLALFFMLAGRKTLNGIGNLNWMIALVFSLLLFCIVGGANTIFVMYISPLLRGWSRVSVFIGFCSIGVFLIIINEYTKKIKFVSVLIFTILILGVYDQNPIINKESSLKKYENEKKFFDNLSSLAPNGKIFELPYFPFPEGGVFHGWPDYSHLRGYLFTKDISWSYGGMKGREADLFYRGLGLMLPEKLIKTLDAYGFSGIYLDRKGYASNGKADEMVRLLEAELGAPLLVSNDSNLIYFKIKGNAGAKENPLENFEVVGDTHLNPGQCSIDLINLRPPRSENIVSVDKIFTISGWVGNAKILSEPKDVRVMLKGVEKSYQYESEIGMARPDVASAQNNVFLKNSGFIALIKFNNQLSKGSYALEIKYKQGSRTFICPTNYYLNL
jgi:phosphoglycerol transferase